MRTGQVCHLKERATALLERVDVAGGERDVRFEFVGSDRGLLDPEKPALHRKDGDEVTSVQDHAARESDELS